MQNVDLEGLVSRTQGMTNKTTLTGLVCASRAL